MQTRMILRITFVFFLCVLFFFVIFYLGDIKFADILQSVRQASFLSLFLVLTAMFGQLFIQALSWQILLAGSGDNISFRKTCTAIFVGWVANFFTPSMYLGGEPIRAYLITKDTQIPFQRAIASVFVHKCLEFTAFFVLIITGAFLAFLRFPLKGEIRATVLFSIVCMSLIFVLVVSAVISKRLFFTWFARLLIRWRLAVRFLEKYLPKIQEMETGIIDGFYKSPFHTVISLILMLAFEVMIFIRPLFFFCFMGRILDFGELGLLFLMIQLIQAVQPTPGGIGILEGGIIAIFSLISVNGADAMAFATFCRAGDILIVSTGFLIGIYQGYPTVGNKFTKSQI